MKRRSEVFKYLEVGVYAALIYYAIIYLRIPMPTNFVHVGNALVVLSVLMMGFKRGVVASFIGITIFDYYAGYITGTPFILLENLIVLVVVNFLSHHAFKRRDTPNIIVTIGIVGGVTKIVAKIGATLLESLLIKGVSWEAAWALIIQKLPATLMTAAVTAILVIVLYLPMKQVFQRFHPIGE